MIKKPNLIAVSGDSGGSNALVPVIQLLQKDAQLNVIVSAYRQATDIMAKNKIPFMALTEETSIATIRSLIEIIKPNILVCGTSFKSSVLEKKFILVAQEMKIPSLAIIDFWSNYSLRFCNDDGQLANLPDKIAVMDERAFNEMVSEGFNPDSLVITGQPVFDDLMECKTGFTLQKRQRIWDFFGIVSDSTFVFFCSQPISKLYGSDDSNPLYLGYDEKKVLNLLLSTLEKVSLTHNKKITLLIRPHPREGLLNYKDIESKQITIIVSKEEDLREIMMASDIVIGMATEPLVEACYLNCIVISLQPGLRFSDSLPTNQWGYSYGVYSSEMIPGVIEKMLFDPEAIQDRKARLMQFQHDGKAARRVVTTIYQMIGIKNVTGI